MNMNLNAVKYFCKSMFLSAIGNGTQCHVEDGKDYCKIGTYCDERDNICKCVQSAVPDTFGDCGQYQQIYLIIVHLFSKHDYKSFRF